MSQTPKERYWRANLKLTASLLTVWFLVGYVLSILMAPWLNTFTFLGGPLGFWIAQNGAIYVFVLLILTYCFAMNKLDQKYEEES